MTTAHHAAAFLAHQQYVSSGKLSPALLRQPVYRAWERSHLQGASARRAKAIELDSLETERLLDQQRAIIKAAQPYLHALSVAAGSERHAAMLGDAHAVVLDVVGDEQSVHGPESVPGPGSLLDEGACGANGIGTPLAEGGYVELVGPEHFIEGFHPFTCQGIPVHDPHGGIVASVSVSVRRPEAGQRLREILICAAHGMEMELMRARLEQDIRRVVSSRELSDGLLEDLRQDIVQAHAAARLEVELAARDLARSRVQYAARLLEMANRSMQVFRRQSELWRDLVSLEQAMPQPIELTTLVHDIARLLETEARTSHLTVDTSQVAEPVSIVGDPRQTARRVFRAFLQAFEVARGGGCVRISVGVVAGGLGEARFEAIAAASPAATALHSIKLPLSKLLLTEGDGGFHVES